MKSGIVTPDNAVNTVEALPLGWTQINRGKKRRKIDNAGDDNNCCDDPTCSNDTTNVPTSTTTKQACPKSNADADNTSEAIGGNTPSKAMYVELEGKALFCLHSLDCSWFQGQFINARSSSSTKQSARGSFMKSLGLLARQRDDLDECLKCSDGGYREIDLTLLASARKKGPEPNRNNNKNNNNTLQEAQRKSMCVEKLSCTGGDMLQIKTPLDESSDGVAKVRGITVSFEADQIITGKRVAPLVRRYFSSLVDSEGDVLEQLPDCAIVVGDMKMTLPQSFLNNKSKADPLPKKYDDDDDDDWLE